MTTVTVSMIKCCFVLLLSSFAIAQQISPSIMSAPFLYTSPNGLNTLKVQEDGNIVLYSAYLMGAPSAFWNSGTSGKGSPPYSLVMQNDGNLVLYDAGSTVDSSKATWQSNSRGKGTAPYNLTMQDDGDLVIYDANAQPIWATGTKNQVLPSGFYPATSTLDDAGCNSAVGGGSVPASDPRNPDVQCNPQDDSKYTTPVVLAGGVGGSQSYRWQSCLTGAFVNQICYGIKDDHSGKNYIDAISLKWTDGTQVYLGSSNSRTLYNAHLSPKLPMLCIDIDVDGGETVTSFAVSADNSAQTCSAGCLFNGFHLQTRHPNGISQTFNVNSGNYAADVGSGMICGYSARSDSSIDAFGLVFLRKIVSSHVTNAVANLDATSDNGAGNSAEDFMGGVFFCPKPLSSNVCSNSIAYQYGTTATMTHSSLSSWQRTYTQDVSITLKMKDIGKTTVGFTAQEQSSGSQTNTQTYVNTSVVTNTLTVPCNCPSGIPVNSYCNFQFKFADVAQYTNTMWSGVNELTLDSGAILLAPVGGVVSGRYASAEVSAMPIVCNSDARIAAIPPALSPPPPPATNSACFLFVDYDLTTGDTVPWTELEAIPVSVDIADADMCASHCIKSPYCDGYKWCNTTTKACSAMSVTPITSSASLKRRLAQADTLHNNMAMSRELLLYSYMTIDDANAIKNPQGDPTCALWASQGISCKPDLGYVAPLTTVGSDIEANTWAWQKALSGVFVDKICFGYVVLVNTGAWQLLQIDFYYQDDVNRTRPYQIGNGRSPDWAKTLDADCFDIDVAGGDLVTSLSLGTGMPAQRAPYSDDPMTAFAVSSFNIAVQRPDGTRYSYQSRYQYGRLYNADVGSGHIAGFVGAHTTMNGLKYGFGTNGGLVDNLAVVFLRPVESSYLEKPTIKIDQGGITGGSGNSQFYGGSFNCNTAGATNVFSLTQSFQYGTQSTATVTQVSTFSKQYTETLAIELEFPIIDIFTPVLNLKFTFAQQSTSTSTDTQINDIKNTQTNNAVVPFNCPMNIPDNTLCHFQIDTEQAISWSSVSWSTYVVLQLKGGKTLSFPIDGYTSGSFQSLNISTSKISCDIPKPPPTLPASPPLAPPPPPADVCSLFVMELDPINPSRSIIGDPTVIDYCSCYRACDNDDTCTGFKFCGKDQQPKTCIPIHVTQVDSFGVNPTLDAECPVAAKRHLRNRRML